MLGSLNLISSTTSDLFKAKTVASMSRGYFKEQTADGNTHAGSGVPISVGPPRGKFSDAYLVEME